MAVAVRQKGKSPAGRRCRTRHGTAIANRRDTATAKAAAVLDAMDRAVERVAAEIAYACPQTKEARPYWTHVEAYAGAQVRATLDYCVDKARAVLSGRAHSVCGPAPTAHTLWIDKLTVALREARLGLTVCISPHQTTQELVTVSIQRALGENKTV
jgi:hypothetical protein